MRRRTVLRRSAAIGAIAVAGCTGDGGGNGNGNGGGNGNGDGNGDGDGTESPTPTTDGFAGFADYSTETTNTDCDSGSAGSAEVAFDADAIRVTITGTLEAPTPCYRTSFEGVKYDSESDALRVTIAAKQEDVDVCQECVGAIDYETTLDLEGGLPGTVVVKHGSGSGADEVARVDSDGA